jgi:kynureninase
MLKGWWGSQETARFLKQDQGLHATMGADMFRVSTPHALLNGSLWASVQVFGEAGLDRLIRKQFLLTGYLEHLLLQVFGKPGDRETPILKIVTPSDPKRRGSQLSLMFGRSLELVQEALLKRGIVVSDKNAFQWINQ